MKKVILTGVCLLLGAQGVLAQDFVKKLEIPAGFIRAEDYEYAQLDNLDFNRDGNLEFIIRGDGLTTYKALDPSNGYAEVWSFTGNPDDYAPVWDRFYFRFNGFHHIAAGQTHALIGIEYYDAADVQQFGLLFLNVMDNSLSWRLDNYFYDGVLKYEDSGTTLEDFILYNRATGNDEIWGYGTPQSAVPADDVPASLNVSQNAPNPFNPRTDFTFSVDRSAETRLEIHDVRGRLIRSVHLGLLGAGDHHWTWSGEDNAGRQVGSGTYFYTIVAGRDRQAKKMTVLR